MIHGAKQVEPLDQHRFRVEKDGKFKIYNLDWKAAEESGDVFLRKDDQLYSDWLTEAKEPPLSAPMIEFDYSGDSTSNIGFFNMHPELEGMLSIDKLSYEGLGEEEHLVFTVLCNDGAELDDDLVNRMLELPGTIIGDCPAETTTFSDKRTMLLNFQQQQVEESNKQYYLEECDKIDAYSEDLKEGLKHDLKELKKIITEKSKEFRFSTNLLLADMLAIKDEIDKMKKKRKTMERDINKREDEIDEMNEQLQAEIRDKLKGNSLITHVMTLGFRLK